MRPAVVAPLVALAVLAALPVFVGGGYGRHLFILAFIYAVVASSWALTLGYGGIFNFAHLAFFGLGVYGCGIAVKVLGLSPWLGLPIGALAGVVAAAIVCLPVLRLKGIYVVLITFAFAQLCMHLILTQSGVTGGTQGMVSIPTLKIGDYNFARDGRLAFYFSGLALLAVSTLALLAIVRSRFGIGLVALRDNEDYAVSRGVSVARQRLIAMMASGALAGLAGAYYALYLRVASPDIFGFGLMSLVLSMVLVGGAATVYGPILAAFLLTFATEAMIELGAWRFIIVSLLMILVVRFAPGGLFSILERLAPKRWAARAAAKAGDGGVPAA